MPSENVNRNKSIETSNDDVTKAKPGMISEAKNLYEGEADKRGRRPWVTEYPVLRKPVENEETARYALLVRNKECFDDRRPLEIHSIIIQSPLLRDALGAVLRNYPGITTGLARLTFTPPFEAFVHRWTIFRNVLSKEEDPETKSHLDLLYTILEEELKESIKVRDDLIAHNVITFSYLWMLFEPGTVVYTRGGGQEEAVRLQRGDYQQTQCGKIYSLRCEKVEWDGEDFGHYNTNVSIGEFGGTAPITGLSAFPLDFHSKAEQVKEHLIERGRIFEQLRGYHYQAYQGIAVGKGAWGLVKYNVNSRIIIDTYAWNRFNPNSQVQVSKFVTAKASASNSWTPEDSDNHDEDVDYIEHDESVVEDTTAKSIEFAGGKNFKTLTKEQLLLCGATIKGYSLKNKKWLTFYIESVKEIRYNETAFESLVLPEDHKELILALTESQRQNKETFDDVIEGKGKGMIMLLSGPPGVGKTLTAESVAESMKAPLYMMSAGDLGTASSEVESNLSNVLEMVTKWNAILLLDEADVFLEQRSSHDLERNKLVSIFLRILEYYEGILFLTTNRVDNIDAAFQSRIHISMEYNELSTDARRHVWANFVASLSQANEFSSADLDKLASYTMNGREIKNILKTAQLLASRKDTPLRYEHINTVLAIEKRHL